MKTRGTGIDHLLYILAMLLLVKSKLEIAGVVLPAIGLVVGAIGFLVRRGCPVGRRLGARTDRRARRVFTRDE